MKEQSHSGRSTPYRVERFLHVAIPTPFLNSPLAIILSRNASLPRVVADQQFY